MQVAPKILTSRQIAAYLYNTIKRKLYGKAAVAPYKPAFGEAVDKILIHAGVRVGGWGGSGRVT